MSIKLKLDNVKCDILYATFGTIFISPCIRNLQQKKILLNERKAINNSKIIFRRSFIMILEKKRILLDRIFLSTPLPFFLVDILFRIVSIARCNTLLLLHISIAAHKTTRRHDRTTIERHAGYFY